MTNQDDSQKKPEITETCGPELIRAAIADLSNRDRRLRKKAHDLLVETGDPAARCLVETLVSPDDRARWEAMKILDQVNVDWHQHADDSTIRALIADLGSKDGLVRVLARRALITIGARAVSALENALASADTVIRWESAKALGQIGNPHATIALITALEDEIFDVRWLAAEGLVAIGRPALAPLLQELKKRPDSLYLREGVHHILHGIYQADLEEVLHPVLSALEDIEAALEVPLATETALKLLDRLPSKRTYPKNRPISAG